MGLKSGSRNPFDDGDEHQSEDVGEREETDEREESGKPTEEHESDGERPAERASRTESLEQPDDSERLRLDEIPYKLRRNRVNEGREQVPFFLREHVLEGDDELQATLEGLLEEKVYKSDYREAAMVVAQRNPELVADVLREWGYDL